MLGGRAARIRHRSPSRARSNGSRRGCCAGSPACCARGRRPATRAVLRWRPRRRTLPAGIPSSSIRPFLSTTRRSGNTLIHSAPARACRRTAAITASTPSATSTTSSCDWQIQHGSFLAMAAGAGQPAPARRTIRGPAIRPFFTASRAAMSRCATSLTVRIVVTPASSVVRRLADVSNATVPSERR